MRALMPILVTTIPNSTKISASRANDYAIHSADISCLSLGWSILREFALRRQSGMSWITDRLKALSADETHSTKKVPNEPVL